MMAPTLKPRVLIVEDDPDLLVVLRVNLTAIGVEPILAGDGRTAISRIQAEHPDAVIFAKRIDMGPESMEAMTAPLEAVPTTEPGVYRFQTDLTMAGSWALSLGAKVQGETGTVENKLIVKATE